MCVKIETLSNKIIDFRTDVYNIIIYHSLPNDQ